MMMAASALKVNPSETDTLLCVCVLSSLLLSTSPNDLLLLLLLMCSPFLVWWLAVSHQMSSAFTPLKYLTLLLMLLLWQLNSLLNGRLGVDLSLPLDVFVSLVVSLGVKMWSGVCVTKTDKQPPVTPSRYLVG